VNMDFVLAIKEIGNEKGIDPEVLFKAVEEALVIAYKRNFNSAQNVRVELNKDTGDFHVFEQRKVVEQPTNRDEISLE